MPLISDSIGRVLGERYRLLSALGTGASAHVFLAEDISLQRHVAIKVLQPVFVDDEGFLKRFRAEARSVASLNHPHVLRVFDWGEDTDGPYLVLEYLGGGSLRNMLDRGVALTHAQAAHLGSQVASGLVYAHARGLVHRDIKPANLLFDEEGRVRIADFGVARALAEAAWTEPAGSMVGTARYASPEQAEGKTLDGRSDVYSLALVLYEALTGVVPFTSDTTVGTLMARVGAPLPRHDGLGPLDEVLARAANPQVDARLDSVQLGARLQAVEAGLPAVTPLPIAVVKHDAPSAKSGFTPPAVEELTQLDSSATDRTLAPKANESGDSTMVGIKAGPGEIFDLEVVESESPVPLAVKPKRSRRMLWVGGVVALCAAIVAGLLVANAEKAFTASHRVPTLTGSTLAAARQALDKDHFTLVLGAPAYSTTGVPAGTIVSQNPSPSKLLKEGSQVTVIASKGPLPETVPSLLGLTCAGAQRVLSVVHLTGQCLTPVYSTAVPTAGQVINWSFANKLNATIASYGGTVLIAISNGLPPVALPSYAGQSYAAVSAALSALGLQASESMQSSTSVPAGQVIGTTPPAGGQAPVGSTVTVIVSSGPPSVPVPDVSGMKVPAAEAAMRSAGFVVGNVYGPANGHVFATTPPAGQQAQEGSTVNLYTV